MAAKDLIQPRKRPKSDWLRQKGESYAAPLGEGEAGQKWYYMQRAATDVLVTHYAKTVAKMIKECACEDQSHNPTENCHQSKGRGKN